MADLTQYPHSMYDDPITGKPTQKTAARIIESGIQMPVEIQSKRMLSIQTHNAVSIAASSLSASSWIDTDGFGEIALTLLNAVSGTASIELDWSNDAITKHGFEIGIPSGTVTRTVNPSAIVTKARYVMINVKNGDAGAAHTMTAWAYLKA